MSKWFGRFVIVLVIVLVSSIVLAQDDSIDVGDTVEDTANGTSIDYEVQLEEGQAVIITFESNEFDTYLELYNDDNTLLESNDDTEGTNSRVIFTPPSDGTYRIHLRSFEGESPQGSYTLSVESSNVQVRMDAGSLSYGDTVTVETDGVITIAYTFEGSAGDVVSIRAKSTTGEDSRLLLYGPDGEEIATDDDTGSILNPAIIRLELPDNGTYSLEVQGFSEEPLMDPIEVSLEETELLLLNDGPQTVQLNTDQLIDRVTFDPEAGESYLITVSTEQPVVTNMFVTIHEVGEFERVTNLSFSGSRIVSFSYEPDRSDRVSITLEIFVFDDESVNATIEVEPLSES